MEAARLLTVASGWTLVALLAATIALPYAARRDPRLRRPARKLPAWQHVHIWVGHVVALGTLVHAWASMTPGIAGTANAVGLYLATAALAVLAAQWGVGMALWRRSPRRSPTLLRFHHLLMVVLVVLTTGHLALNT